MGCTASTDVKRVQNNQQLNGNLFIKEDNQLLLNEQNKENRADNNKVTTEDFKSSSVNISQEEEAAIKIQAGYRGYKTRKDLKIKKNMKEDENPMNPDDPEVNKAATTIQAGFKGYKVRKEIKKQKSEGSSNEGSPKKADAKGSVSDEIADIDLNDAELEKAATKIQATFRGYKTRKEPNNE